MTAADLARFSQVGYLDDDSLVSTGTPGYLFFGPYQSLKEGMYVLTLEGDFSQASDVILDVVSDKGTKVHFKSQLCDSGCRDGRLVFGFPLAADTQDLEIRMQVSADSVITVHRYRITDAKHDH